MGQVCCNYAAKDGNLQKFGGIDKGKNIVVNNAELLKAYSVGK